MKMENHLDLRPIKTKYGVPADLEACHTGVVGGYVVEGHVPADVIGTYKPTCQPGHNPRNERGATPTTVTGRPLTTMSWPSTAGSRSKRCSQS